MKYQVKDMQFSDVETAMVVAINTQSDIVGLEANGVIWSFKLFKLRNGDGTL